MGCLKTRPRDRSCSRNLCREQRTGLRRRIGRPRSGRSIGWRATSARPRTRARTKPISFAAEPAAAGDHPVLRRARPRVARDFPALGKVEARDPPRRAASLVAWPVTTVLASCRPPERSRRKRSAISQDLFGGQSPALGLHMLFVKSDRLVQVIEHYQLTLVKHCSDPTILLQRRLRVRNHDDAGIREFFLEGCKALLPKLVITDGGDLIDKVVVEGDRH